ncbi:MAG: hypothetical protein A2144_11215 [Chloroflexi bacterium RBG_16_50_9]|nr:MAG: hypothetical protein A2144_11215 [Chloroflexi bacterium RBG_16_50_9]
MDSNNDMKIKRSDLAVWRVVDGEVVILLPEEAALHALTGCGTRVWELIEKETAISEIVERICAEYEVEPQQANEDITEFVHKLAEMKLVDTVPAVCVEGSC